MPSVDTIIRSVRARVCYDSRGDETVEVEVEVDGVEGRACAPRGASAGRYEVIAFGEGGAKGTVRLIGEYSPKLIGADASDIALVTRLLREIDGTDNFSRIGGAAAYAIGIAVAEAAAKKKGVPLYQLLSPNGPYQLPYPIGNVLCGGKHAGPGSPDIQEFLVCPVGANGISEALRMNILVHREVYKLIRKRDPLFTGGKGDEGGWAPRMGDEEGFEVVSTAVKNVVEATGVEMRLGVDVAASSMWDEKAKTYVYGKAGVKRSAGEQLEYIIDLVRRYALFYVEDPLHEEAYEEFAELTRRLKGVFVVGDDLFVTNATRLLKGAELRAANAAILKVNQVGTLGDALRFAESAERHGYALISSHRSGDTTDAHLAHIAVGTRSKMMKSGVVGGERLSKLNELLRIGEGLEKAGMVGLGV